MNILEALNWRYATKKYDTSKKISAQDLETIKEVLRLTPSSYGLQPLKFLIVENPEIRKELRTHSWGQSPVTDASHLLVFCSYIDVDDQHIDLHIENTANTRKTDVSNLAGYGEFVKTKMKSLALNEKKIWNSKQAYIALGQLLLACAQMGIDATPMEGFESEKYDEILGLTKQNLHAALVCPIGYRSSEDLAQFNTKIRKSSADMFEII